MNINLKKEVKNSFKKVLDRYTVNSEDQSEPGMLGIDEPIYWVKLTDEAAAALGLLGRRHVAEDRSGHNVNQRG